jgi:hypothetical protein
MIQSEIDFKIEDLLSTGQLSEKAFITCKINKIQYISELVMAYHTSRGYVYWLDCDKYIRTELIKLYHQYHHLEFSTHTDDTTEQLSASQETPVDAEILKLQQFFTQCLSELSPRARRSLTYNVRVGRHDSDLELILDQQLKLNELWRVDHKIEAELQQLRQKCLVFIAREKIAHVS